MKLPQLESKNLEFKEFLQNYGRVAEAVVAFANGQGGEVIIGVRDVDREVLGLDEDQIRKYQQEIPQAVADQISPQIAVDTFERNIGGKVCFVIKVFPGPHKPYFISRLGYPKGIFVRFGSHNRRADDYAVRDLERQRNHVSYEQQINPNALFEALSLHMLERIVHSTNPDAFVSSGYGIVDADQRVKANTSGVLLFHTKPSEVIPEAYLTVTRYAGTKTTAIASRERFDGSVVEQFEGALEYLREATGVDFALRDAEMLPSRHAYPVEAVRELLINALVHRAYDFEAPIRVSLFSDRFEILNPGMFYAPINERTLRDGLSRYRNPIVAQAFRKLNYMEKQGVGINRIFGSCAEAGLPEPLFLELEHHVKVVIRAREPLIAAMPPGLGVREQSAQMGDSEPYNKYMRHFDRSDRLTSREFAHAIGKSQAMAKKILFALCRRGLVRMIGRARATYYVPNR